MGFPHLHEGLKNAFGECLRNAFVRPSGIAGASPKQLCTMGYMSRRDYVR